MNPHPNMNYIRMVYILTKGVTAISDYLLLNETDSCDCIVEQYVAEWFVEKECRRL